jgi:hypothetical protein
MEEDWAYLAQMTATELGFEAVRWWHDTQKPHLLCIEAQHTVGEDCIRVMLVKFLPEYGPPIVTVLASPPMEPGPQQRQLCQESPASAH